MSHRQMSVRDRVRGVLVLLLAAGLALPVLVAAGGRSSDATTDAVIALARAQVGDRYVWGGTGPDTWDCSGLTSYVWREAGGVVLPRVSGDQQKRAVAIPREQLLPGDLAFFGDPVTHVALYVGDGRVVDASSAKTGVLERPLWSAKDVRYGRVARPDMPPVQPWTPPSPSPSPSVPAAGPTPSPADSPRPSSVPTPARPTTTPTSRATTAAATRPSTSPSATRPSASPTATRPTPSATRPPSAGPATTKAPAKPVATAPAPTKPAATAPAPAKPVPTASPAPKPAAEEPTPSRPAPKPVASRPTPAVRPLASLPGTQVRPSTAVALKAVVAAKALAGATDGNDTSLVRAVWLRSGGLRLPLDRGALLARARQVPRLDVRVGDLVSYGTPSSQVYLYAGHGYMVGFSTGHRAVVVRRVHTGDVRFLRLPTS